MQRHLLRVSLAFLAGAAALLAADFWEKRAPEDWAAEEVESILTDSPWAQGASLAFVGDTSQPIGGGSGGGIGIPRSPFPTSGPTTRTGQPDGGWSGKFSAVGTESRAFRDGDIVVRWSSALPIREALQQAGAADRVPRPELLRDYYVVSLSSVPPGMARLIDEPEQLRTSARLTMKDRPDTRAERIEVRPQPGTPAVDFCFPRGSELTADDRQIVFELVAEDYELKAKFKPRDMLYRGKLEL